MKEPKRARRRRDLLRMKARAQRIYPHNDPSEAAKLANHIKCCSGHCCGNPRRHFNEPTMQERRHA